jgi:MoaA/NifB/PqqE/SkfB family radical SAM enzyme
MQKKMAVLVLFFTGGEFTIRKDCLQLVCEAKKLGYSTIQVQSNGRMFSNRDFCNKIIAAGANQFSPAVHGHTPELHDYLTNAKGAFAQVIQGIRNLKSLKQEVIVNHVIVKPNYRYAVDFAHLMVELTVDQFQYAFVHAMGSAADNFEQMVPQKSLVIPYIQRGIDVAVKGNVRVMVEAIPFCLMKGYEKYVSELYIPPTRI